MENATSTPSAEAKALSRWENEGGRSETLPPALPRCHGHGISRIAPCTPADPGHHTSTTLVPGALRK
jgi:hypothetical protein